ncbi:MAG: hypothetical protein K9N55_00495 [Phycisphaerae bacterium]|nr:hypothetical protein [Phycisphaerae bacterium]
MKAAIRVLKADEVEVSGTYSLATGLSTRPGQQDTTEVLGTPQARIMEQHPQYAVLEITCACGHTMQVKCDYSQALTTS